MKLFSFLFLSLVSATAFADGFGYSGPNLSGDSVPVQLDRGITLESIVTAVNVCVAGDSNSTVVPLLKRLTFQVWGATNKGMVGNTNSCSKEKGCLAAGAIPYPNAIRTYEASLTDNRIFYFHAAQWPNEEVVVELPNGLPTIKWDEELSDTAYDEFGRAKYDAMVVRGVRIELPAGYGSAVKFVNSETKRETKLTVNMVEYVECLKNQIQKHAE